MILIHDPLCIEYGSPERPERPARIIEASALLRARHPDWEWRIPSYPGEPILRLAHSAEHLERLQQPPDFDDDTPYLPGIYEHARRSVGGAVDAMELARKHGSKAFSLMRPPGHHATAAQAMGFCYLNQVAIAAIVARQQGAKRVAVWDFDAHHGNGTQAILHDRENILFASVHQLPGYPDTGATHIGNCWNYPVAPRTPRARHLEILRASWEELLAFSPDLILVSAGFDGYVRDPVANLSLEAADYATLGSWLKASPAPVAAVLEGGYSGDLPLLIDSFLTAWV